MGNRPSTIGDGPGSGPYPASWFEEASLTKHTVYMPDAPPANEALPVLIWGNGACDNNGTLFVNLLTNIASYGFTVLASGPIDGSGTTKPEMMRDAVDWVMRNAGRPGKYKTVDSSKIAVAGQSCGGLEAYQMRDDDRVSFLGIFNSGFFEEEPFFPGLIPWEPATSIQEVHKPVFYFLGGEDDIAYPNGMRDYEALTGVPKWVGNYPVGHLGTYSQKDGGAFGVAAVKWLSWILKGDLTAAQFFTGGGAEAAGWIETASEDLDNLLTFDGSA